MIENLVKEVIKEGGSVKPLLIPSELTGGTGLTNPSILVDKGEIKLNLRHVQYTLYHAEGEQKFQNAWGGPLAYINPEDDITLTTVNYLCTLHPDTLEISTINKVDTSKLDVTPIWEFVGLEDARLVNWEDSTYLIGVRRDTTTTGEGRMEFSKIEKNKEVTRNRIEPPTGPGTSYCEKNWMPILDMPYHFVKWSNPTEVVKVDLSTNTSQTVHLGHNPVSLPRDIRGGSQVIPFGEYRIALTHEVELFSTEKGNKDAQYYHRFIVWDKDWNIVSTSEDFKFLTANIEFSCGMAFHKNELLITFGFQDTTSYLLRMPIPFLTKFLKLKELTTQDKLKNFPPVYYVSFEKDGHRREVLNNQFDELGIKNYTPIISTKKMDIKSIIKGTYLSEVEKPQQYNSTSHLRAIKTWIENNTSDYALFLEDDVTLESIEHWNFTWDSFIEALPEDWDCVQLTCVREDNNQVTFREREWDDWSVTAYILTREYAQRLLENYYNGKEFNLDIQGTNLVPIVENIIYSLGKTYAIPLFVENPKSISTYFLREGEKLNFELHQYNQYYHQESSKEVLNWWKENGKVTNIKDLVCKK
jgi:hypothetical protein